MSNVNKKVKVTISEDLSFQTLGISFLIASEQFLHGELELEETTKPSQQILAQHQISFIFHI